MVADVHRTLLYGGIFMHPRLWMEPGKSKAKLRLLYEAAPMAFLMEQAGGRATTGEEDILSIQPTGLHERCAVIMGSADDVATYLEFHMGRR